MNFLADVTQCKGIFTMLNSIKLGFIVLLTLFTSLNVQAAGGLH